MNEKTAMPGQLSAGGIADIEAPPPPPAAGAGIIPLTMALIIAVLVAVVFHHLRPGPVLRCIREQRRRLLSGAPVRACLHESGRLFHEHGMASCPLMERLQMLRFAKNEPDRQQAIELLDSIEQSLGRRS